MSAAHTPGRDRNWRASAGRSGYGAHDGVTVTDNRGLVVAVAIGDVPELDALATARLIAAAPDLLAALTSIANAHVDGLDLAQDSAVLSRAVKIASRAIAKAMGQ